MASIINAIKTRFTSDGANGTAAATESVTKAQTRLGQASASSGRQFAAQSQGLGGLVAAYAGAAATIFALEAAYTALSKAAQAETIVKGTSALALEVGQSGPRILASLQKISQGQLTLAETAQNANIALSAGFNTQQIERLTSVALGASRALGRDFTDALQRVIRGTAKLEPELLDELGIFTRIDPAVAAYAKTLNISASNLTQFEKRQAFVNAVISEGERKFSAIDTSSGSAQKSLEQLRVEVTNLGTQLFETVANVLTPFVNFLKNDAGNTLLLFGSLLGLVFQKGIGVMADFAHSGLNNLDKFAVGLATRAEAAKGTFGEITKASEEFNDSLTTRGGLTGGKGGTGSFAQGAGLNKEQISAAALARQNFKAGGATVGAMRDTDIKALTVAQKALSAAGKEGTLAFKDATKILGVYSAAASKATLSTSFFSAAAKAAAATAKGLTVAMEYLNVVLGVVFTVITVAQLAGTLFDVDLLGWVAKKINGITIASENAKQGFLGLTEAAGRGGAAFTAALKSSGADDKYLENLNGKLKDTSDAFDKLSKGGGTLPGANNLSLLQQARVPGVTGIGGLFEGKDATTIKNRVGPKQPGISNDTYDKQIKGLLKIQYLTDDIVIRQTKLNELRADPDSSAETIQAQERQLLLTQKTLETTKAYGIGLEGVVGSLAKASGIDGGGIAKTLSDPNAIGIKTITTDLTDATIGTIKLTDSVTLLGLKLKAADDGTIDFEKLTEKQKVYASNTVLLNKTLTDSEEAFKSGSTNAEAWGAKLSGASAALVELKTSTTGLDSLLSQGLNQQQARAVLDKQIQDLTASIDDQRTALQELVVVNNVLTGIQKNFGGAINKVDTTAFSGLISVTGDIAKNTEQMKGNQAEYLRSIVDAGLAAEKIVKPNKTQLDTISAGVTAQKALLGTLLQNYDATIQILEAEQKKKQALQEELKLLQMQNAIAVSIAANTYSGTISKNALDSAQRVTELGRAQLSNTIASNSVTIQRMKNTNSIADAEAQIGLAQGSYNAAAAKASLEAVRNQGLILQSAQQLKELERSPGATSKDITAKQRENIELERKVLTDNYNNQRAAIMAQGSSAKAALDAQKASVDRQKETIDAEIAFKIQQRAEDNRLFRQETANLVAKIQADITKNENEQKIIEATQKLDIARVTSQQAIANQQYAIVDAQLKGYDTFATSTNAFTAGIATFAHTVAELLGVAGNTASQAAIEQSALSLPGEITTNLTDTIQAAKDSQKAQNDLFQTQIDQITAIGVLTKANKQAEAAGLEALKVDTLKLRTVEQDGRNAAVSAAVEQLRTNKKLLDIEIRRAEAEASGGGAGRLNELLQLQAEFDNSILSLTGKVSDLNAELNVWDNALLAVKDTLKSSISQALVDLNASFFNTANDLRSFGEKVQDAFYNIFKSVQETFFQKAIADPIAQFVTNSVSGLFGGLSSTKGADNADVINGALVTTTRTVGGGGDTTDPITTAIEDGDNFFSKTWSSIKSGFSSIFGQGGFVSNVVGGIFGQDGILSSALQGLGSIGKSVFSGLGSFLSNVISGISGGGGFFSSIISAFSGAPTVSAAAGGVIHMAQGGGVNALRDRVPAMLEPGEFVMRKQAVKSIGTPALQAMNAGGRSNGEVVVNIKNEGTPQSATASAPKFDGEKFVIDIVTRDLQNNGAIRRTMRAGS